MLQMISKKAWQEVTFKCKKLTFKNPPLFKSYDGDISLDIAEAALISDSCEVTMVI